MGLTHARRGPLPSDDIEVKRLISRSFHNWQAGRSAEPRHQDTPFVKVRRRQGTKWGASSAWHDASVVPPIGHGQVSYVPQIPTVDRVRAQIPGQSLALLAGASFWRQLRIISGGA